MTAQDGLKIAQKCPQDGSRGPKTAQEVSERTIRKGPKRPKSSISLTLLIDFGVITFPGFRQFKTAQEASEMAQKTANDATQYEPRGVQGGLKKAQDGF